MAGYLSVKMKRKDLEDVYDDTSEFSLSSPARKIRKLDAELPPIMEEEESSGFPLDFDQVLPEERPFFAPVNEALSLSSNEERALVLYKPMNAPLLKSPSSPNFSITVNSECIPGLKDQGFWPGHWKLLKSVENDAEHRYEYSGGNGECLALVPWVQSQFPSAIEGEVGGARTSTTGLSEPMEAEEEVEDAGMEIEMDNNVVGFAPPGWEEQQKNVETLQQQWKQQHCTTPPQLPQSSSTPITWSW